MARNAAKQDDNGVLNSPRMRSIPFEGLPYGLTRKFESTIILPSRLDERFYNLNDERKKIAVIFNHFSYNLTSGGQASNRDGTDVDCETIRKCFNEKLGFSTYVYQDLALERIKEVIEEVSKESSANVSCIAVVVMTHGTKGGILLAYDEPYEKNDLLTPFLDKDTKLKGVPKLFIIQACRGKNIDEGLVAEDGESISNEGQKIPSHADFLMIYSTVEDFVSWRGSEGSFFIHTICEQMDRHADEWDLLQILTFVNWTMAKNFEAFESESGIEVTKKQMPQFESTLTKLVKFRLQRAQRHIESFLK